jgi:hypothetical protein
VSFACNAGSSGDASAVALAEPNVGVVASR